VESAIGFTPWAVDDQTKRAAALEQFRRDMEMVAALGGTRIAAPPSGINRTPDMDLRAIAERYRSLLEIGRQVGVVPQLECWGSALTLGRASEAAFVVVEANHPDACLLLDAYQLYKGGSGFEGLRLFGALGMHVFHINDYPADRRGDGEGRRPGLSGRRRLSSGSRAAKPVRRRFPRRPVAGNLQPHVLARTTTPSRWLGPDWRRPER